MYMRRTLYGLVATFPVLALVPADHAAAADLKLRMSVESAPGAATQVMLAAFRDALQEEMGDAVEIEYFDGGTLGDEIVHMEQVRTGQLDVIPIGSDAVQLDSKWAIFDMPFLFPDRETASRILGRRESGIRLRRGRDSAPRRRRAPGSCSPEAAARRLSRRSRRSAAGGRAPPPCAARSPR